MHVIKVSHQNGIHLSVTTLRSVGREGEQLETLYLCIKYARDAAEYLGSIAYYKARRIKNLSLTFIRYV